VNRLAELAATVIAGAVGSTLAVLTLGASLVFVVPVAIGVGAIALAATRQPRPRQTDHEPQNA
jgi:uncharacterized membrane protein YccC